MSSRTVQYVEMSYSQLVKENTRPVVLASSLRTAEQKPTKHLCIHLCCVPSLRGLHISVKCTNVSMRIADNYHSIL